MNKKITKDKWIWQPHPAHFICSYNCRFVLATKVGKYMVSTVGELWQDRAVREIHAKVHDPNWLSKHSRLLGDYFDAAYFKKFGFGELGLSRTYETMVFKARRSKHGEKCCPYEIIVRKEVDMVGYNDAESAYKGHMKLCNKWSKK